MNTSSVLNVRCSLVPEEGSEIQPIVLEHLKDTPVGRTPECMIHDVTVSRRQVIITADFLKEEVTIKSIGLNPSLLNGLCLAKGEPYKARNNNILELVESGPKYRISFLKPVEFEDRLIENKPNSSTEGVSAINSSFAPPAKKMKQDDASQSLQSVNDVIWINTRKPILLCKYGPVDQEIQDMKSRTTEFQIAAFDLDGTIIKTKSGNVHPIGPTDWTLWNDVILSSLRKLRNEGYLIALLTNQASLRFQSNIPAFKSKVEAIVRLINLPMVVLISTNEDFYRKPAPGMWFYLKDSVLGESECSMEKSFYVGDAAGRVAGWKPGKPRDFSNSDRLFASNLKLDFKTPEAYFLKETEGRYSEPEFLPWDYGDTHDLDSLFGNLKSSNPEVIVMVGLPASGKSTFVKTHLVPIGYIAVNRDTLGTAVKCEKLLKDSLVCRKKVVVDNTNLDLDARKKIINICQQFNVVPRCFLMDSTFQRCQHNNRFRRIKGYDHAIISPMVMRACLSKFVEPAIEEGFLDIVRVPFIPSFRNDEDRTLYNYHLLVPK